jgi:hypothetical protein
MEVDNDSGVGASAGRAGRSSFASSGTTSMTTDAVPACPFVLAGELAAAGAAGAAPVDEVLEFAVERAGAHQPPEQAIDKEVHNAISDRAAGLRYGMEFREDYAGWRRNGTGLGAFRSVRRPSCVNGRRRA